MRRKEILFVFLEFQLSKIFSVDALIIIITRIRIIWNIRFLLIFLLCLWIVKIFHGSLYMSILSGFINLLWFNLWVVIIFVLWLKLGLKDYLAKYFKWLLSLLQKALSSALYIGCQVFVVRDTMYCISQGKLNKHFISNKHHQEIYIDISEIFVTRTV